MILVDTSVWVAHLNSGDPQLADLLEQGEVLMHPCVLGELACGSMRNRRQLLDFLEELPQAIVASDEEVLQFIDNSRLVGKNLGYVEAQLLASMVLSGLRCLWTRDKRLAEIVQSLGYLYEPDEMPPYLTTIAPSQSNQVQGQGQSQGA
ncbi:MAG: PIN domain-containing protein [Pseudomonadales bacterium]|jgi:predicted nucleic acid-binding protein|nr:PIN domain-containing protein [Pseudomonadales bacterium]